MSERHSAWQTEIRATEAALRDEMLWLPNLPHESVPVAASEDDNRPWPPKATSANSTSRRCRTGSWRRPSASSTWSAASSSPAAAATY